MQVNRSQMNERSLPCKESDQVQSEKVKIPVEQENVIENLISKLRSEIIQRLEDSKDRIGANRLRRLLTSTKGSKEKLIELVQKNCK